MSGPWRVTGVSTNGNAADIGDDTHCVANGVRTDKAELICQEHNAALEAQPPAPSGEYDWCPDWQDVLSFLGYYRGRIPDYPEGVHAAIGRLSVAARCIAAAQPPATAAAPQEPGGQTG